MSRFSCHGFAIKEEVRILGILLPPPVDDTQCTLIAVEQDDVKVEQEDENENINL
jgi:hypothetical protein